MVTTFLPNSTTLKEAIAVKMNVNTAPGNSKKVK
jgi:hypothetical protein